MLERGIFEKWSRGDVTQDMHDGRVATGCLLMSVVWRRVHVNTSLDRMHSYVKIDYGDKEGL